MESTGITQQILQVHLWTVPNMLLIKQTGGSREPWGHSSWCLESYIIKMYVSFIQMPAPSLCHMSGPPDFRREQNHSSDCGSDTKKRTTPGWSEGIWAWDTTVQFFLHIILYPCKRLLCLMWTGNMRRVWFCVTLHREKGQKTVTLVKDNRPINHLHHDSLSVCLAHTGDTANVLLRFLCGVSILAQGSDLRGHGVLVMPPRLTVPVCPQSVCKQIKRRSLFN